MNKKRIILLTIGIFILLLITISLSFAYFVSEITGGETDTTIQGESGIMQIHYDGGSAINVTNMFPSNEPFTTKSFTVTGNSTTPENMKYNLSIIMESNTFSAGGLKYKLFSTNTSGNGNIVPSILGLIDIETGPHTITLGNGSFVGPTGGNKIHSYKLELYFPKTGGDQSIDQGRSFEAYVKTEEGEVNIPSYLGNAILNQYGGEENITTASPTTFGNINTSTENKLYKIADDYGTSYYYRGAKNYINNNLIFAEHQWKIVRINGDGSIKLIYNGTCPNNSCSINTTGASTEYGISSYNNNGTDSKYVGYMYGGLEGEGSTSRAQATTNETNSTIKTYLDNWYLSNIKETEYESYLTDTLFCNDRQLSSEVGGLETGLGFGRSETFYAALQRLYFSKSPNLKCGLKNERFTVSDTNIGNGALTYPVGLITADEAAIAGMVAGDDNLTNYLNTEQYWWTFSPGAFDGSFTDAWNVSDTGVLSNGHYTKLNFGLRASINIKFGTQVIGTGSAAEPYLVIENLNKYFN